IYEPMNDLLLETRILEIREVFNANFTVIKTEVTLANHKKTFAGTMFDNVDKRLKDIVGDNGKIKYNVLDEAVKIASEAIKNAQTELEFINGITGRDKDNPNLLTRFTGRGIGVSSDGGNTFPDAITGHGVNTNLLTAGQIKTNNVQIVGEENLFYWDGNKLIAIDPTDMNKYVELKSSGLTIKKGALEVERPDGYKIIVGGKLNHEFNLGSPQPSWTDAGINISSGWWRTNSTEYLNCQTFYFKHSARYVQFDFGAYVEGGGAVNVVVRDSPNGNVLGFYSTDRDSSNIDQSTNFVVDLGVPDGSLKALFFRIRATQSTSYAYARTTRQFLRD